MINNWEKFNESKTQELTEEIVYEVCSFFSISDFSFQNGWFGRIQTQLSQYISRLMPIDSLYKKSDDKYRHEKFQKTIDAILEQAKKDNRLNTLLLNAYVRVKEHMDGFPAYHKIDDILLEYVDLGFIERCNFNGLRKKLLISLSGSDGFDVEKMQEIANTIIRKLKYYCNKQIVISSIMNNYVSIKIE